MRRVLIGFELALWVVTLILAVLWFRAPATPRLEPAIAILGALSVAVSAARSLHHHKITRARVTAMPLIRDHLAILEALNANEVNYLVVGGFAALAYGEARSTGDLDIWAGGAERNQARLRVALANIGIAAPIPFPSMLRLGDRPIDLYIGNRYGQNRFDDSYRRRRQLHVQGLVVSLIAPEDNRRPHGGA